VSGDLCIYGSSVAKLCEQAGQQLNSPIVSLQTCLVTFAYMAAQWPSFVGSQGSSSLCSEQAWPQGPRSLWDWLVQWNTCRHFDDDYLVLWGARYLYSTLLTFALLTHSPAYKYKNCRVEQVWPKDDSRAECIQMVQLAAAVPGLHSAG